MSVWFQNGRTICVWTNCHRTNTRTVPGQTWQRSDVWRHWGLCFCSLGDAWSSGRLIHGQLIIKCVKLLSKCVKTTLKLRQNYSTTSLELGSGHRTSPLPWSSDFLKMVINHPVINRPVIKRPVIKRPVINGPRALYWSPSCQPLVSPPAILSFAVRYSGSE